MALQKQLAPISLRGGIDTKSDPKQVVAGQLLVLENGVFSSPGAIRKRDGFAAVSSRIAGGGRIESGRALATFGDELLVCDGEELHSYSEASETWTRKGPLRSCRVTQAPVVRDTYEQSGQDGATHPGGLQTYAWEDSRGGVRYSVVDSATGQTIVASRALAPAGIKPRVVAFANLFAIFWVNATDGRLYVARLPVATPTVALTPLAVTGSAGGANALDPVTPNYDVTTVDTPEGERLFLAYRSADGGLGVWSFTPTGLPNPVAKARVGSLDVRAVTVFADLANRRPVVALYDGTSLWFAAFAVDLSSTVASGVVDTLADIVSVTGVGLTDGLQVFWSQSAARPSDYRTRTCTISSTYVAGAPTPLLRSVALAGKAFVHGGRAYVPLAHDSELQPTYFVADEDGQIVARLLPGLGGGIPRRADGRGAAMLPCVSSVGAGAVRLALLAKDLLSSEGGAVYTQRGVVSLTLDFEDAAHGFLGAELGGGLHVSGGGLVLYDGVGPVEHGFHLFPEGLTASTASGGGLSAGQYQWVACYEWTDAQGQVHRSAPSVPVTATVTSGQRATITVPTLRLTEKRGDRAPVAVVVYRTAANGSVFFRATSGTAPLLNDPDADSVTFVDGTSDTTLVGNPQLYTTGGVVENVSPGPLDALAAHRNRMFALDASNRLQVWYSKPVSPGAPVEFSDVFVLNVDASGGEITALASLDDKLVVCKRDRIFVVTGQGPDATGAQDDFSDAVLVTTDCGCINPRSVVTTPHGLMFQSSKGIHLLDRSLAVSHVGAPVEAYRADAVTSALLVATASQVRFALASGVCLVFDYDVGQWSVFTPLSAVDAVMWGASYCYLRADGVVLRETPGVFADDGRHIRLRLVTSWLQFVNLQGFQRVYRVLVLGEYASPHRLRVRLAYDFDPSFVQDNLIEPESPSTYGGDSAYGSGNVFGGRFPRYQHRLHCERQKCEAIQIAVEDVQSGQPGEGMHLSALTFEVGLKAGPFRISANRSTG